MTREDFNKHSFSADTVFKYKGIIYDVVSLHFIEGLLGLDIYNDPNNLTWVRCESGDIANT
jgi:hypothetical protein